MLKLNFRFAESKWYRNFVSPIRLYSFGFCMNKLFDLKLLFSLRENNDAGIVDLELAAFSQLQPSFCWKSG